MFKNNKFRKISWNQQEILHLFCFLLVFIFNSHVSGSYSNFLTDIALCCNKSPIFCFRFKFCYVYNKRRDNQIRHQYLPII